jgi:hypothetical protein
MFNIRNTVTRCCNEHGVTGLRDTLTQKGGSGFDLAKTSYAVHCRCWITYSAPDHD